MLIVGDSEEQDQLGLTILAEVREMESTRNIARWEAIQEVATARNFGEWGIEQYVELGEAIESLEAAWKLHGCG